MICPLLVSLLATSEKTASLAGIPKANARRRMLPIIRQTLRNYEKLGGGRAHLQRAHRAWGYSNHMRSLDRTH